jgi:hypothetical protein
VSWSVCLICGKRERGSVRLAGFYRRPGFMFRRSAFSVPNLRFPDDTPGITNFPEHSLRTTRAQVQHGYQSVNLEAVTAAALAWAFRWPLRPH